MSNLITSGSIVLRPDNLLRLFRTSVLCGFLALCFSGSQAFAAVCIPPPSGLVSWWTAEGNATDAVGTNNGSFQGSATANGVGMVGSAFSFNGNSSYIQIPDSPSEKPTNLTIEAWVNFTSLDSTGTGAPAGDQYIVFKQNSRTMLFEGYDVSKTRVAGGDVFRFQIASSAGTEIDLHATNHISTGTWYHIAAVRGSNFMQIYVNGNLENQTSVSFPQDYGTLPLYFGTSGESFWDRKLYGLLDEVSLYNRVLSSNEIAAIYVAGAAGKCGAARILGQPQSQSVTLGSNATFTVSASGTAPLAYQWQRSNTNLNNAGNISGASSSALTISAVSTNDAASYRVIVSNIVGAVTSSPASLTVVIPAPPQVVNLPATGIAGTFATGNGQIVTAGSSTPSVTLFYGPADGGTNPGGWQSSASAGLQTGSFSQVLSGLATNTTYYFTARAVNNAGTAWATPSLTFKTASNNPAVNYAAVLSQHNDDSRTGANLKETILTPTNVNTNQFGLIYTRLVDDQIYAQPLVMTNVNIAGRGLRNIVLIATVNDTVYAFDADDPTVVTPYWQVSFLGPNIVPPSWDDILASPCGNFRNISGYFGIVGTPVIDPLTGTMYVVARTKEFGTNYVQRLHALSVADGSERPNSPVVITGSVPGTGAGASGGIVTFNPFMQNQRPGLAISKGVVYVGWTSHCDWDPYHGWLMGFDASTLQRVCIYNTAPNGSEAGIWMSGAAPAVDTNGNLYISVGNGTVGVTGNPRDTTNRGQSFLKLTPSGTNLNITSWFTPYNWSNLNLQDLDLGSAGILLIPGTSYAFSGGKQGIVYLVDRDNMGGLSSAASDTNVLQSFSVTAANIHGSPIWWDGANGSFTYVWGEQDYLRQFKFDRPTARFVLPSYAVSPTPAPSGMPGAMLAVSANGTNSGVVWASHPLNADANGSVVTGILLAYDAQNVGVELWNSQRVSGRDAVGNFAKYCPPTVANGKVYLATFSNRLNVYGLLPAPLLGAQMSGKNIMLSWQTNTFLNYALQSTTNLATANWSNVTATATGIAGGLRVTLPATSGASFYRLKR